MTEALSSLPSNVKNQELVVERRAQLVAACTDLFTRNGFHKTTTREITTAVGWQMGMLYNYVSSKEDLLYLITETIQDEYSRSIHVANEDDTATENLKRVMVTMLRTVDRMQHQIRLAYRETASLLPHHREKINAIEQRNRAYLVSLIESGISRGEFRPVNPEVTAHNLIMISAGWALKAWYLRDLMDVDEYANEQVSLLLNGLCTREATSAPF